MNLLSYISLYVLITLCYCKGDNINTYEKTYLVKGKIKGFSNIMNTIYEKPNLIVITDNGNLYCEIDEKNPIKFNTFFNIAKIAFSGDYNIFGYGTCNIRFQKDPPKSIYS